ncbi:MAG: acetyl-CoA acyltransferase [Myxococcales bacterium]
MNDVVIVDALRTPFGKHLGGLKMVRTDDLAAHALRAVLDRSGVDPAAVDEVILGCANQAGEDNRNVARMALLLAGMPQHVPGVTVNRLCGSSLEAVNLAARAIRCGDADIVLTGGVESMSRAPWVMGKPVDGQPRGNQTLYDTSLGWRFPNPAMEALFPLEAMGETAENLVERYGISREDQDRFALGSHLKAAAAWEAGRFEREVVPVAIPQRKGAPVVVARDEGVRADTTLEALGRLGAAFRKGGSVTAGNSSTLNDGASAVLLMSRGRAEALGLRPLATWRGGAAAGVDPRVMGIGPVPATRKALAMAGLEVGGVDLVELNEAFAAQSLAVVRELGLDEGRVNVNGGAIAIGHPLGASGGRVLASLVHELGRREGRFGLATMCIGVGQGIATVVERE